MYVTEQIHIAAFLVATGRMRCLEIEKNKLGRAEFMLDGSESAGRAAELAFESGEAVSAAALLNAYFGLKKTMYRTIDKLEIKNYARSAR